MASKKRVLSLESALLEAGLTPIERAEPLDITKDEKLLAEVATAWKDNQEAIKLVIQARVDQLVRYIAFKSDPIEVMPKREALFELAGIITDFEKFAEEIDRRKKDRETE